MENIFYANSDNSLCNIVHSYSVSDHSSRDLETLGFQKNAFGAALERGIARQTILLTALLDLAHRFSSTVDNLTHIFHTEVHLVDDIPAADTPTQETGAGVATLSVAARHDWHGGHVSLLTGRSLVSLNTLVASQQTREVSGNIALHRSAWLVASTISRFVGLVGLISSSIAGLVGFIGLISSSIPGLVGLVASSIARLVRLIASSIARLVGLIASSIARLVGLVFIAIWPFCRSSNTEESEDQEYRNSYHG